MLPLLQGSNGKARVDVLAEYMPERGGSSASVADTEVDDPVIQAATSRAGPSRPRARNTGSKASSVASGSKVIELD